MMNTSEKKSRIGGGVLRMVAIIAVITGLVGGILPFGTMSAQAAHNPHGPAPTGTGFRFAAGARESIFFAYVKAGEMLSVGSGLNSRATFTVTNPDGITYDVTNIASQNKPPNSFWRSGTYGPSTTDGIWTISMNSLGSGSLAYNWDVTVKGADNREIPGRVWTYEIDANQNGPVDLEYWAIDQNGYLYYVDMPGFHGIDFRLIADATGISSAADTCTPAYKSRSKHRPETLRPSSACGDPFKIFFEPPAADLPTSAQIAPGKTEWIVNPPATAANINIKNFSFTRPDPSAAAGTFSWDMAGFSGNYTLQIDVDNNGKYNDPVDVILHRADSSGHETQAWDGRNGLGATVPATQKIRARVFIETVGEFHLVMDDVEYRPMMKITRLTGPGSPDSTIYWNDTNISGTPASGPKDGSGGVDSSTGTHGWTDGSYGNEKLIDDWMYGFPIDLASDTLFLPDMPFDATKTAAPASGSAVLPGQLITYTLTLAGRGGIESEIKTSDDMSGILDDADLVSGPHVSGAPVTVGPIDANGIMPIQGTVPAGTTATITYTVQVKDYADQGDHTLRNVLQCYNAPGSGGTCTPSVAEHHVAHLTLDKTVSPNDLAHYISGQQLTYSFEVRNDGTADVTGVTIDELSFTGSGSMSNITWTWPGGAGELKAGETASGQATYTLTDADMLKPEVANRARATGSADGVNVESDEAAARIPAAPMARLQLVKDANVTGLNSPARVGDKIVYDFQITNLGNQALHDVAVLDSLPGLGSISYDAPFTTTDHTLQPGQTVGAHATYTVTQADLDAGKVSNNATVTGITSGGDPADPGQANKEVPLQASPALEVVKSVDKSTLSNPVKEHERLLYTITITNVGQQTAYNVQLSDPLIPAARLSYAWPGADGVLAPGEAVKVTGSYDLVLSDLNAGSVRNTATATGETPGGTPVTPATGSAQADLLGLSPALQVVKTADKSALSNPVRSGDTITYSVTVKNSGNQTAKNVSVSDPLVPGLTFNWPGAVGELNPGQSVTATGSYTLTQADLNLGQVKNTATATGEDPTGRPVTPAYGSTTTDLAGGADLSVVKTSDKSNLSNPVKVGDKILYTIKVTNTGNKTAYNVAVADPKIPASGLTFQWPGAAGELAPGEMVTVTGSYTLTQADLDAEVVMNTATANGEDPPGTPLPPSTGGETTDLDDVEPVLSVIKSADKWGLSTAPKVGEAVVYTIKVTNTGNQTAHNVTVSDPKIPAKDLTFMWPGADGVLAPGETVTATGPYALTQADIDAGRVYNLATATGDDPSNKPITPGNGKETTDLSGAPVLAVTKTADKSGLSDPVQVGEKILYTIKVTNSGNQTTHNVTVSDPKIPAKDLTFTWPGTAGELAPGEVVTVTGSYTVTQADLNVGKVDNVATADGDDPSNKPVPPTNGGTTTDLSGAPALSVTKTANKSGLSDPVQVGEKITYTITVTNSGNQTAHNVTVTDPKIPTKDLTFRWPSVNGVLAPGETVTVTGEYTLTQADLDAGKVDNVATAGGETPGGGSIPPTDGGTTTDLSGAPVLAVTKTADKSSLSDPVQVGEKIVYTIKVTNSGNQTAKNVTVSDPKIPAKDLTFTWPGTAGELTPGETVTATGEYALTQADLDAGKVDNVATAGGETPGGGTVPPTDGGTTTDLSATPVLAVTKTADKSGLSDPAKVGEKILYTIKVTNSGNQTAHNVAVSDPKIPAKDLTFTWPGTAGELPPGETVTVTGLYALTQADIDAGRVYNSATATGNDPDGKTTPPGQGGSTTDLSGRPALAVTKTADESGLSTLPQAGEKIVYTITVTNSGNQTAKNVTVDDPKIPAKDLTFQWPGVAGELAPGEVVTVTGSYTVTQADLDAGKVDNVATAGGETPGGSSIPPTDGGTTTDLTGAPALSVAKTADKSNLSDPAKVGEKIAYTIKVTNTGNQTAHNVTVADPKIPAGDLTFTWPSVDGALAPGETVTVTGSYAVTQADLNAGKVDNMATAGGETPGGGTVPPTNGGTTTDLTGGPALSVIKTADKSGLSDPVQVGEEIVYTIKVINSGNQTAHNVTVADPKIPAKDLTFTWPGTAGELAPGEVVTVTGSYTVTQADLDAGKVDNVATAGGETPGGGTVPPTDGGTTTDLNGGPALSVVKTADMSKLSTPAKAGEQVYYTIKVTNTGNQTANNVTVTDAFIPTTGLTFQWPGADGVLAPGESVTVTGWYTLTQRIIDTGLVYNLAIASGDGPGGKPIPPTTGDITSSLSGGPALSVAKTADKSNLSDPAKVGEKILYTIKVTNTGNQTAKNVTVGDPKIPAKDLTFRWPGADGELAPGETVTVTGSYALTQADLDAGKVDNVATAGGETPGGSSVPPTDGGTTTDLNGGPALSVTKTADKSNLSDPAKVGEKIVYTIKVTNTGNQTAHNVTVSDPKISATGLTFRWPGTDGELAPGETVTVTGEYALTQADLNAGKVDNVATAGGDDPADKPMPPTDGGTTTDLTGDPVLAVTKTADKSGLSDPVHVGEKILYTIKVTNTGNRTAHNVTVDDPKIPAGDLTFTWPGVDGELAPGETVTVTGSYAVTQADLNAGKVDNVATAGGDDPADKPMPPTDGGTTTDLTGDPVLAVTKTADKSGLSDPVHVGEKILYTIKVTNTGNQTAHKVTVDDPKIPAGDLTFTWPGADGELVPGETVTVTGKYALTQADLDAGKVNNVATAGGETPGGGTVPPTNGGTTTDLSGAPVLALTKTADKSGLSTPTQVGEKILYTITVTNTGNQTAHNVTVSDPKIPTARLSYVWPGQVGVLAPGESITVTGSYTVTKTDLDAGKVYNVATATGRDPNGGPTNTGNGNNTVDLGRQISSQTGGTVYAQPLNWLGLLPLVVGTLLLILPRLRRRSSDLA